MDNKYISFPTAERYWRTGILPETTESDPMYVLVPNASQRNKGKKYICHVMPKDLPNNSFVEINRNVFVACPELCFLQAAAHYQLHNLVMLGNDLCATYYLEKNSQFNQQNRMSVTSKASIEKYLAECKKINGLRNARLGCKYIIDNANSPMESKLAVIMNLPISFGGYALKPPKLNHEIVLSEGGVQILGIKTCKGDAVWEDQKVALEYDSTTVHFSLEQFHYDKKRATAINISGYKVISVTSEQLKSYLSVENLFEALRQELGMRKETARFEKYADKRWQVINEIILNKKVMA